MAVRNSVDVLRYWLALLRHEEALAVRPRARKIAPNELPAVPSLTAPTPGQDYMKLPFAGQARFFGAKRGRIEQQMDGEANAFFEDGTLPTDVADLLQQRMWIDPEQPDVLFMEHWVFKYEVLPQGL